MAQQNLHIEYAEEADLPEIMAFLVPAFERYPSERLLGRVDTEEAREAVGQQHAHAWKLHAEETGTRCGIKCVHRDLSSGAETIVGFCEWMIYPKQRAQDKFAEPTYLLAGSWVTPRERRAEAVEMLQDVLDARVKWLGDHPAGILMYMVVHPAWRRKGISTLCVRWGLQKCDELRIPSLLEASEDGAKVYEKLGFERVDELCGFPLMLRWPPGTPDERKVPALPNWKKDKDHID